MKEIASVYGPAAIERAAKLAGLVLEGDTPVGMALSEQAQISALNIILERAYGKAPQGIVAQVGVTKDAIDELLEEVGIFANGIPSA